MLKLQILTVSTRPGRSGPAIAAWATDVARTHGKFDVTPVDLVDVGLPLFDEPNHPRLGKYEHDHTKRWSALVDAADAFVFVTPEYNFSAPPSLVNALDYLAREWAYKPVGFVSYGGVSAGTRSVQSAKQIVTTLKMMPIPEAVAVPMFTQHLKDGVFAPPENQLKAAQGMLDELSRWATALKTLR